MYHIPQIVYNCTRNPHICTEPEKYSWGIGFRYFLPDSVGILRMYWHFKKSPVCGSHRRFIATGESRFSTVLWIFHIYWCLRGVLKNKNTGSSLYVRSQSTFIRTKGWFYFRLKNKRSKNVMYATGTVLVHVRKNIFKKYEDNNILKKRSVFKFSLF